MPRPDRAARRREEARKRRNRQRRRPSSGPRRWIAGGAALVVAAAVVAGIVSRGGDDTGPKPRPLYDAGDRSGSKVQRSATPLRFGAVPMSYDVTYAVEDYAGGRRVDSTDRLRVRRPFESRIETRQGPPPGRGEPSVQVSTFGRLDVLARGGSEATSIVVPPAIAGSDIRVEHVLASLISDGLVQRREQRQLDGRRCQVYRTTKTLGSSTPEKLAKAPTAFVDTCIDRQGLVLEELTVDDKRLLRRKRASSVGVGLRLADALFPRGTPAKTGTGRGSVLRVEPTKGAVGEFWELDSPPAGFRRYGRFAVVPPQPEVEGQDPEETRAGRLASVVDVWTRGSEVLMIDQGGTLGRVKRVDIPEGAERASLGELGEGGVLPSPATSEVRIVRPQGRFVRIVGTIAPGELVGIARALRRTEGTGLVYIDTPPGGQPPAG